MQKELEEMIIDKELEQMIIDKELFIELLPLFEKMSKRGQNATIETLITYVIKEV